MIMSEPLSKRSGAASAPERRRCANAIRALSMDAVQAANSGHPGAPMGMADVAEILWRDFLKHNPQNPETRRASRRRPARWARVSPMASAWRSPKVTSPAAAIGPDTRSSITILTFSPAMVASWKAFHTKPARSRERSASVS